MADQNDEDLAAAARDPERFTALVQRHGRAVHAYLARRSSPDTADDLLAEVWLAAFASRGTYDQRRGPARGWLFGVARHVLATHHRRRAVVAGAGRGRPGAAAPGVVGAAQFERGRRRAGVLAGTARSRLHRARRTVLDHLGPETTPSLTGRTR